ncbi:NADH-quinone oxidoreductase subunit N [Actinopolymorpha alba]|uniref:NADH-quinone oxidoreductase subunit N n=1 Tax=Actinopolymorpha alba TaxID=533267 RepID=UPI00035CCDAA|nr:NADH-quinone oxidoreductase subunit N [Actinopolymorpha alba]
MGAAAVVAAAGTAGTTAAAGTAGAAVTQPVDWAVIAPPLVVALTAIAVLVVDAFLRGSRARGAGGVPATTWIALVGLFAGLLLLVPLLGERRGVFCSGTGTGTGAGHGGGAGAGAVMGESCSYVVDSTTLVFQLIAAGGAMLVVLLSTRGTLGERIPIGEYLFLLLASASGAMTLAGARDLITLVVALEVVSLPAFALVGLRGGDKRAAEAALKFFLVSVVSVAVMLFGISLVYGVTGSVYLGEIATALASGAEPVGVAAVGVVLTLVGLGFKVAAVPFHFWVPDTYVGAPVPVAAYLSVVSKAAGLVGLLVVVSMGFPSYATVWAPALGVLAALTMTLGNLVALRQRNAVRLLAWSSIAQAGYLLVPLGAVAGVAGRSGTAAGVAGPGPDAAGSTPVLAATVAYLLIYAVVNLGAFAVVAWVAGGRGTHELSDYRGMFWSDPLRACALAFFLLALAGLPPGVAGLFAKVVVFRAAVDGGAGWLAVVMAVNVVIGLAYYLYWTALLFATPADVPASASAAAPAPASVAVAARAPAWPANVAIAVTATLGVVLSVAPGLALDVLRQLRLPF